MSMSTVFERIEAKLMEAKAAYTVSRHAPVYTSEEAAAIRGVPLSSGAKALIVKAGERFVLFVLPADRKFDGKKVKSSFNVKGTRFATKEEVFEMTDLLPGSIPPFGSLFGLPTFVDGALSHNESINFNAGDHAISIQMPYRDYFMAESPTVADCTIG
jgi:Ala-tRNA(Pro) deacylase